jgi:orotidine-5'-phosphate decarboxylase
MTMNADQEAKLQTRVIAALDLPTLEEAVALVDTLGARIAHYKIGSKLFTKYGPRILEALAERDVQVFLDLKYHDIPSVVADAVRNAAEFENVFMVTVHASGGERMVRQASEAAREFEAGPKVVAVTALTSLSEAEIRAFGVEASLDDWAEQLAESAVSAGADGVVCSALEAQRFRAVLGREPLLVTPGIRLAGAADDDQTRVMTPGRALSAGSDFLVIGRPIYQADDPAAAVNAIGESL